MANKSMPLTMARSGAKVTIVDVLAGQGLKKRLADMGLLPGTKIRVVNSQMPGPVIMEIKGSKVALGRGAAHRVTVKETTNG